MGWRVRESLPVKMNEAAPAQIRTAPSSPWRDLFLLATLVVILFGHRLGGSSLWDSDEPKYGEAAWEMVQTGDWLVPRFNFTERFDKPPFFYWCIGASYLLFGYHELATRLPAALFGGITVILTYFLGRLLFSRRVGLWGGVALATAFQFILQSRLAVVDTTLTFFLTTAMYGIAGIMRDPTRARYYWYLSLGMAMATLTKGPIGILFPSLLGAIGFTLFGTWGRLRRPLLLLGGAAFLALVVPWYWAMTHRYGHTYSESFFIFHNVVRFLTPVDHQSGPWYYYFMILPAGFFPWSAFAVPIAAVLAAPGLAAPEFRREIRWLGAWALLVLAFFTVAATKLPNYILPLFPAAALLAAILWEPAITGHPLLGSLIRLSSAALLLLLGSFTAALPVILYRKYPHLPSGTLNALLGPSALLLTTLVIAGALLWKGRRHAASFLTLGLGFALFVLVTLRVVAPHVEANKPVKRMAASITASPLSENDRILTYRLASTSLVYYTRHQVIPVNEPEELAEHLSRPGRTFVLVPEKEYGALEPKFSGTLTLLKTDARLLLLVKEKPLSREEPAQ